MHFAAGFICVSRAFSKIQGIPWGFTGVPGCSREIPGDLMRDLKSFQEYILSVNPKRVKAKTT